MDSSITLVEDYYASSSAQTSRRFFVPIGSSGLLSALRTLNEQLIQAGRKKLLSSKLDAQEDFVLEDLGLIEHRELPKIILTREGSWSKLLWGAKGLSEPVIQLKDLSIVQLPPNQSAVVLDPQRRAFVANSPGFVAYPTDGAYKVLSIFDNNGTDSEEEVMHHALVRQQGTEPDSSMITRDLQGRKVVHTPDMPPMIATIDNPYPFLTYYLI